jgi:hypothetical protein
MGRFRDEMLLHEGRRPRNLPKPVASNADPSK